MSNHIFLNTIGVELDCSEPNINSMPCTICGEKALHFVKKVKSKRTPNYWPSYFCLHCESVVNDSKFTEDEVQLRKDLDWNISVSDRNRKYLKSLVQIFDKNKIPYKNVLEVGCGIGTVLHELRRRHKSKVFGYDVNEIAINYGKENYGLKNIHSDIFTAKTKVKANIELVLCISVLEHIKHPNDLFKEIAEFCRINNSTAFISVPFVDANRWNQYYPEHEGKKYNFLTACDVHISYFSTKAFINMAIQNKCTSLKRIQAGAWVGYLLKF